VDSNFTNLNNDKAEVSSLSDVATSGEYNDLTGKPTLGTMAIQNKTSVDIEGGTIDGTVIGSTTPAAGTFTALSTGTLTATGQTSLGGASGAEGLRVLNTASSTRYLTAQGSVADEVYLTASGPSGSNVALALSSRSTGAVRFYTNTANQEQMRVSHTASAVNYVQVTGAATTGLPQISAQGSDNNPGLLYITKGIGEHRFASNASGANIQFRIPHTASAVNYGTVTGAAAGASPKFSVAGSDTNIDLTLTPKGTGNVKFGTYTASMALTVQGYIEIKDSGGTVRKLAVIA
jgi:hypothetical protein